LGNKLGFIRVDSTSIITDEGYEFSFKWPNENREFCFSCVTLPDFFNLSFYDLYYIDRKKWSEICDKLIQERKHQVDKWILFTDWGEAFSSVKIDAMYAKEHIQAVIKYFKKHRMSKKLVWRGNGLNPQFKYDIKFEPISFWLGKSMHHATSIKPRPFDYHFLSLYRGYKKYREDFHNFLQESGVLKKTLFSYNSEYKFDEQSHWTNDYMVSLDDKESITAEMLVEPGSYYQKTFCSIVYEAFWDEKVVFPTEKLNKCLLTGHPFIIVSTPRYLANIKKLGFKTFDKWWDESYDDEVDNKKRMKKLQNLVLEISSWSIQKCRKVYAEMMPVVINNQKVMYNLSINNAHDSFNLLDIEIDKFKKPLL
jgi:hypothetical protein